jgi:glycerol-3-phosphate dehydrogenase
MASKMGSDPLFDLIVIGGGINGAAIAREAALSGNSVLLIEREDFCAGTSAASTRLIHGGLRYLEHAEFGLVHESLAERERLLRTAPHLIEPLEIFLPLTRSSRRGRLTVRLGLTLYDLLSLGKSLPRHRGLDREALLHALPGLAPDGLLGGAAYYDAQVTFPERLVLELALDAETAGATLASHTSVRELLVEDGRIAGVAWASAGHSGIVRARVVVNATGPWVDSVLGRRQGSPLIGGTRGSHLIARPFAGAPPRAVYAEAASDGRPFFVIPWNGLYLIGTTDERDTGDPGAAVMSRAEYDYLIAGTRTLFPGARDLEQAVCYTCSGIRPLPASGKRATGAITRSHLVVPHPGIAGLYSIVGGKLTTHRALAVDCLRRLGAELGTREPSPTVDRPLPGALSPDDRDALLATAGRAVGETTAARWWRTYGGASRVLLAGIRDSAELGQKIGSGSDLLVAELAHAVEAEHARTLVDLLHRRTMAGLAADLGQRDAPLAADWLVRLGIWDRERATEEVAAYRNFICRFAVPRRSPAGLSPGDPA